MPDVIIKSIEGRDHETMPVVMDKLGQLQNVVEKICPSHFWKGEIREALSVTKDIAVMLRDILWETDGYE